MGAHSEICLGNLGIREFKISGIWKNLPSYSWAEISVFENFELLEFLEFVKKNAQLAKKSKNKKIGENIYIPPT